MSSRHSAAAVFAAAAFALPVHAQTTAPAAPAATSTVAIPTLQCEKPGDLPGLEPSAAQMSRFQKRVDDYKVCVNEYAKTTGAKANEYAELARAHANAANAAIEGYNAYVTDLNERTKKK